MVKLLDLLFFILKWRRRPVIDKYALIYLGACENGTPLIGYPPSATPEDRHIYPAQFLLPPQFPASDTHITRDKSA